MQTTRTLRLIRALTTSLVALLATLSLVLAAWATEGGAADTSGAATDTVLTDADGAAMEAAADDEAADDEAADDEDETEDETEDEDEDDDAVVVGYYENEVFQEGAREGAVRSGYAYEYLRKLSEYTGWRYEYAFGTFSDLYDALLAGEVDLLAGLAYTPEREGLIGYPELPMGSETYSILKHVSATSVTASPSTMDGKRIGVLKSAIADRLHEWLAEEGVDATVMTFDDYEQLFKAFDDNRVDLLAAEGDGAYGREDAEVVCSFGSSDYYLCVSGLRDDLRAELDDAQARLAAEEPSYLLTLRQKYYAGSVSSYAFTEAEREWVATHDHLTVGYLNNYLPYSDTTKDGSATGVVTDVVSAMLRGLHLSDIEVTYVGYDSYDEMVAHMAAGHADLVFPVGGGLYYSEEGGIYQSSPVVSATMELVCREGEEQTVPARVAVNENNRMQDYYVRTNFPSSEIVYFRSIDECLEAVLSGAAEATVLNGLRATDILRNSRFEGLMTYHLAASDDRCFGVAFGDIGLLKLVNHGIAVIGSDFGLNASCRYTQGLYTYTAGDFARDHLWPIAGVALGVAALVIFVLTRAVRRTKREVAQRREAQAALEHTNEELAASRVELAEALHAAETSSRAKTVFLSNMSHDIRTPMNAIVGFTQLAQKNVGNDEVVLDYLGKIEVSSQHLLSLINDVLDMSRIESGAVELEEAEYDLADLVADLHTITRTAAHEKGLDLTVACFDIVAERLVGDKLRLSQVLLNLVSNACKFTPAGGHVWLRVFEGEVADGAVALTFEVADDGIGMSEEFQEAIFEAFTRERSSTVSGIQGTGLGMAITKRIVDLMGGTIEVESRPGEGTTFAVTVVQRLAPTNPDLASLALADTSALVVCPTDEVAEALQSSLTALGIESEAVADTLEASSVARVGQTYDVCLVEAETLSTEGRASVEALAHVAGRLVLVGFDVPADLERMRAAGVDAFCSRPALPSVLASAIKDTRQETPYEEVASASVAGAHVLLVEDSALNREIAGAILEAADVKVTYATDGTEAVRAVAEADPGTFDVILMDIQMPTMDGYEATRRIRALLDPGRAYVPIVAVTANAFEEDRRHALEVGMDAHLAKPYDVDAMLSVISELLSRGTPT